MAEIARAVAPDAREAIETDASRCAMHENDERMRPDEMVGTLILNHALCHPAPREIILLDDVITTGCSFVACYTILREQFPDVPISGIFAARRIISNANATDDFADLDLEF